MTMKPAPSPKSPYHHGGLPAALLQSARHLLEKRGIGALGLRAITRHAGVSATAAAPHFGNLTGLLSTLAATGYDELADAMEAARTHGPRTVGLAYVHFALANPGLFTLMFRSDAIDRDHGQLARASARAFSCLAALADGGRAGPPGASSRAAVMAGLWGKVHGLAVLATDGLLSPLVGTKDGPATLDALVAAALR
ncbi:TetR/AcrR family transcriptional regulator [Novacetimonas pomaceti]